MKRGSQQKNDQHPPQKAECHFEAGGYAEREYGVQGYFGQERGGQWGQVPAGEQGFRKMRDVRGIYGSDDLKRRRADLNSHIDRNSGHSERHDRA